MKAINDEFVKLYELTYTIGTTFVLERDGHGLLDSFFMNGRYIIIVCFITPTKLPTLLGVQRCIP